MRDLKSIFIQLDRDKNGVLTKDEMESGFGNICMLELLQDHIHGKDDDDFSLIMNRLDLDGDGKIDYNEFLQAAISHQSLLNKQNIEQMFKLFDANSDGVISCAELKSVFSSNSLKKESSDNFIREVMDEVDKNKDNLISFEEFNNALTSVLSLSVHKH